MSTISIASPTLTLPRTSLRLTRRGRVVVFVAAALMVLLGGLFIGTTSVATNTPGEVTQTEVISVDSGDTLWAIASDLADDGDVRSMMRTIKELNALDSSMLMVGQKIHVPVD